MMRAGIEQLFWLSHIPVSVQFDSCWVFAFPLVDFSRAIIFISVLWFHMNAQILFVDISCYWPLLTRSKTHHQLADFDPPIMNYMICYEEGLRVRSDPLTRGYPQDQGQGWGFANPHEGRVGLGSRKPNPRPSTCPDPYFEQV